MDIKLLISYITKVLIIVGIIIFIVCFYDKLMNIVIPFVGALVLAYLISPVVSWMVKKGINKRASIILIYALIFLVIFFIGVFVVPKLCDMIKGFVLEFPNKISFYKAKTISFVNSVGVKSDVNNFVEYIFDYLGKFATSFFSGLIKNTFLSLKFIIYIFLMFFIGYYIILDGVKFYRSFLWLISSKWRKVVDSIFCEINDVMYKYVVGQITVMFIIGVLYTLVYFAFGIKYALLLGVFGGITNAIPYIGPYIGGIPAVLVAGSSSFNKAVFVFLAIVVMQQIDNQFVTPQVMKAKLGVPPVLSIVSILLFGEFFGFIGVLFGVPIMKVVVIVVNRFVCFKRVGLSESERYLDKFLE